jgi:hypothetical protein
MKEPSHKIVYSLLGFQVETTIEGKADVLKSLIKRIQEIGGQPASAAPASTGSSNSETPKCPRHKSPMKKGKRGYYCPRQVEGGEYCQESA